PRSRREQRRSVLCVALCIVALHVASNTFASAGGGLEGSRTAGTSLQAASGQTSTGAATGQEKVQYASDVMPDVTGAVRLYATHTLCISCLACCCQFKRLLPNVKLE
ncbi:unnamed protein product, partial [Polarella glacialis]